jgi:hypothetical protein
LLCSFYLREFLENAGIWKEWEWIRITTYPTLLKSNCHIKTTKTSSECNT